MPSLIPLNADDTVDVADDVGPLLPACLITNTTATTMMATNNNTPITMPVMAPPLRPKVEIQCTWSTEFKHIWAS